MDQLDDVAGAIAPLRFVASQRGSLAEDALARLVRAFDELGRGAACERARAEYARRFVDGVHADEVTTHCR